jgi:hypothetical protein
MANSLTEPLRIAKLTLEFESIPGPGTFRNFERESCKTVFLGSHKFI